MRSLLLATLLASLILLVWTHEGARLPAPGTAPERPRPAPLRATQTETSEPAARAPSPPVAHAAALPALANEATAAAAGFARASPAGDVAAARRLPAAARGGDVTGAGPGSFGHVASPRSQAISDAIASQESQATMAPLARLYLAYFHRAPDYEGFDYYITEREDGATLESIADEFAGSAEFNARYGELDNASFVDRIHRNVAGIPADMAQRAFWVEQLDAGRMTRGQVMLAFSESAEFQSLTGNEVFVTLAYAEALRREPAPAEFVRWVDFLDAGHPRAALVDALLAGRPPARP